ncbi:hypothetical protein KFK09_000355 [Dendrobium nobile]|uniref:Uncharacterized protein n=1 Tax=Dendrobium nobile TaxID=94219 RepID=A0A8T3CCX6_DENNO|nr:hypothetical protein KFK09_000355 [Dendrobium nobile]
METSLAALDSKPQPKLSRPPLHSSKPKPSRAPSDLDRAGARASPFRSLPDSTVTASGEREREREREREN